MEEQLQDQRLVWVDLEMTGLLPETDQIIEIATVVTDGELNEVAEGPVIAIHQPDELLEAMDDWNTRQHGASGLTERVRASSVGVAEAEARTLAFLAQHVGPRSSPMCGNSICQDRRFMARLMPTLEAFFHYRNLDVSSVKILAAMWNRPVADAVKKESSHLALDDIRDSIAELRLYRERFLRAADEQPA